VVDAQLLLNIAHPARTGGVCGLARLGSGGQALQVAADVAGRDGAR